MDILVLYQHSGDAVLCRTKKDNCDGYTSGECHSNTTPGIGRPSDKETLKLGRSFFLFSRKSISH